MIKTVEYNDGESRLQGHVEILPEPGGTYKVTSYVEDEKYGLSRENVPGEEIEKLLKKQETVVANALKEMAKGFSTKSVFEKLKDKGYDAL